MNFSRWISALFFTVLLLYLGRTVFIPLLYGAMVAMIAFPVCRRMEKKLSRGISIGLSLMLVFSVFFLVLLLFFWEAQVLFHQAPVIREKLIVAGMQWQEWVESVFGWDARAQMEWWQGTLNGMTGSLSKVVNASVNVLFGLLFNVVIIPVFAALLLYNREQYTEALRSMLSSEIRDRLPSILHNAVNSFFNYIVGMLKVYVIVGVLNSLGLMLLGIEDAWLYGMITAVMTMIPYIGIIVSASLPVAVAWVTKDSIIYPLGVVAVFAVVQYLEANVIFPKVVGTQLNLNTLASLLAILLGGLLWGVAGMILFLPFIAVLKIVSDEVPGWETLRLLLGNGKK